MASGRVQTQHGHRVVGGIPTALASDNESGTLNQRWAWRRAFSTQSHNMLPSQPSIQMCCPRLAGTWEPGGRGREELFCELLLLHWQNMQMKDLQGKILLGDATVVNSSSQDLSGA